MEAFLKRFLAKNKYPKILNEIETLEEEFENLAVDEVNSESNASLTLALQNLGIGAKENIEKAEHWARQMEPDIVSLIMLTIALMRNKELNYMSFRTQYKSLLDIAKDVEADDREYLYRFLRLLAGFVQENHEHEFSQDLFVISEWIESQVDAVLMDQLINKWISQGRIHELMFIQWVIGESEKIQYYLPHPEIINEDI